jgi:hypothetical protein
MPLPCPPSPAKKREKISLKYSLTLTTLRMIELQKTFVCFNLSAMFMIFY